MPVLKINHESKKILAGGRSKSPTIDTNLETYNSNEGLIQSFDPSYISMPKYSSKYKNDPNAAAFRHMLGGNRDPSVGP